MNSLDLLAAKNFAAKCAVNIALLDGAARRAGKPIYDHLGLGFTENKHVTSFSIGIAKPEAIRQKVLEVSFGQRPGPLWGVLSRRERETGEDWRHQRCF